MSPTHLEDHGAGDEDAAGRRLEVVADCPTFEKDVRDWCNRSKKVLLWIRDEGGGKKRCQIRF